MSSATKRYHLLSEESSEDGEKQPSFEETPMRFGSPRKQNRLLLAALSLSALLNICLAFYSGRSMAREHAYAVQEHAHAVHVDHTGPSPSFVHMEAAAQPIQELPKSEFAGLVYDQPIEWVRGHFLESTDMRAANKTWQETLDIDPGVIALHKTYAAKHGLPRSSTFAWDTEKEIYYINGFHDLHCVKSLHMAISEFILGEPQTYDLGHITHCLNALRETVICNAEDTPRLALIKPYPPNAPTQSRMCRSWDKLTAWARPLTACYHYINEEAKHLDSMERYKFCAPGSPYQEEVKEYWREHFGHELGY